MVIYLEADIRVFNVYNLTIANIWPTQFPPIRQDNLLRRNFTPKHHLKICLGIGTLKQIPKYLKRHIFLLLSIYSKHYCSEELASAISTYIITHLVNSCYFFIFNPNITYIFLFLHSVYVVNHEICAHMALLRILHIIS